MEEKEREETTVFRQPEGKRKRPFMPTYRHVRRIVDPTIFFREFDKRRKEGKA